MAETEPLERRELIQPRKGQRDPERERPSKAIHQILASMDKDENDDTRIAPNQNVAGDEHPGGHGNVAIAPSLSRSVRIIGAADGNIIAPIITVQTARKMPRPPRVKLASLISTPIAPSQPIGSLMLMAWCSISAQATPVSTIKETGILNGTRLIADARLRTPRVARPLRLRLLGIKSTPSFHT